MAQSVMIHPEILNSPSVLKLPEGVRVMLPWDWVASMPDGFGCFEYNHLLTFAKLANLFPKETPATVGKRFDLYRGGEEPMLEVWESNGRTFGHWLAWFKPVQGSRQMRSLNRYSTDRVARRTPIPPSLVPFGGDPREVTDWKQLIRNCAGTAPVLRGNCAGKSCSPPNSPPNSNTNTNPADGASAFVRFWEIWPHKVGKKAALKAWKAAKDRPDIETILAAVKAYTESKPPDRAWCNPATWINQGRWDDQPAKVGQSGPVPVYLRERKERTPEEIEARLEKLRGGKAAKDGE